MPAPEAQPLTTATETGPGLVLPHRLRHGPLPDWLSVLLWTGALLLVPAGYALVLWTTMGGLAKREREV